MRRLRLRSSLRRGPLAIAVVAVVAVLFGLAALDGFGAVEIPFVGPAQGGHGGHRGPRRAGHAHTSAPVPVTITLDGRVRPLPIPRSFFGLSTEYWALPVFERRLAVFDRVLALLHTLGDGPLLLRVGGDSADHSFWDPRNARVPDWAYPVTPAWLARTRTLVQATGLRLILDLNLVTATPQLAAQWARAAVVGLPPGSIAGFEVGNEPDIYSQAVWRTMLGPSPIGGDPWVDLPRVLTARDYVADFRTYARVLARAAPGIPLVGPALANPIRDRAWLARLLSAEHRTLAAASVHRYPFSGCSRPTSHAYPTIQRLLSGRPTAEMAGDLRPLVRDAAGYHLPLRLTELNSVDCGGRAGVSNTFATALWAPDALFSLLRAGVSGVNLHVRAAAINAPFVISAAGLTARPLLYGLVAFIRALGSHGSLVATRVRDRVPVNLKAWAVRTPTGLNVLVIDKSWRPVTVHLALGRELPASAAASVQRLVAPSPRAVGHVTFDGQRLGPQGQWLGRAATATVTPRHGAYTLRVRGFSAALISLR